MTSDESPSQVAQSAETGARQSTQVAIIGAGPAGLLLGHILGQAGIDYRILEARDKEYVLGRIRAGVLEQDSVDLLAKFGLDADLKANGLTHHGIYLQHEGERHHIDFAELTGRTVTVYGQQALVHHLVAEHERLGSQLIFEATDVQPTRIESTHDGDRASLAYTAPDGERITLDCDYIIGADGYHGVCRRTFPEGTLDVAERVYDFAWLGILADVAPSTDDLIYALHRDGFAMHSMRSTTVSRLYLQVSPDDDIANWSDERIWAALQTRLGTEGWTLTEGPITEKSILPMRSFVVSTLNYGRLYLVGDAGHIVPPTGAKGLNSAIADVALLAEALQAHYAGDDTGLEQYSDKALDRQWKVQHFSQWMTDMLHVHPADGSAEQSAFDFQRQLGQIRYVTSSHAAQVSLAEQYAGLPFVDAR
ncbi:MULTISPECIES: 4-hydroxybenzoate 3-monooxygenase [unclassified Pseudoclavibacter]|uniref:4-hydroxybenzoate 3-monooxygenase n=1 Tax=unclassified Pseudoclavibacter TaxID=2615177 RepID=UPI001BA59E5B|nr:4-hydroxybenzoate 3-monooxygenase [Pseudoclavibacter sp. Marseille-Q4354]MBS3178785.1 4-hydroxybenzoate 3-monooxygenase [Pseudoclavibacter sp. Marseille-Q4354]